MHKPMRFDETELVLIPVPSDASDTNIRPNWRPWSYKWPFFVLVLALHSVQAAFAAVLLVTHFLGETDFLSFDYENTTAYIAWQYTPVAITILSWMAWEILYIDVCRLEPFYQLTDPEGVQLIDSLGIDYLTTFSWFVPMQAWQGKPKRHTAVLLCSVAYLLASNVLPVATVAMYKISWEDSNYDMTVVVIPGIVVCVLATILAINVLGICLLILLRRRQSGVFGDPAGIGGIAALISGSNLLARFQQIRSYDTQARIDEVVGSYHIRLEYKAGHQNPYQICLVDPEQQLPIPPEKPFQQHRREAHSWWLWGKTYLLMILILFGPSLYIQLASRGSVSMNAIAAKICFTLSALINTGITSNWQLNVALLEPFYRLADAKGKPRTASTNPTNSTEPTNTTKPIDPTGMSAVEYDRQLAQRQAEKLAKQQTESITQVKSGPMVNTSDVITQHSPGQQESSDATQQKLLKDLPDQQSKTDTPKQKHAIEGSKSALRLDFISSALHSMFHAMRTNSKSGMVWYISFCVLISQLSVIYSGSMADNSVLVIQEVYDGNITSTSDIPRSIQGSFVIGGVIGLVMGLLWLFALCAMMSKKRKPFIPRKPYTLSSVILYLCNSHTLLEDLSGTSMLSKEARDDRMRRNGHKYGLGWTKPEGEEFSRLAIERVEAIESPFVYKAKLPPTAR